MWMDAHIQQTLSRQRIDEANRTAALRRLVGTAESARARRPCWPGLQRLVRVALTSRPGSPAARVAVR